MKSWKKRILIGLGVIVAIVLVTTVVLWIQYRGEPEWYRPEAMSEDARRFAAQRAEDKLTEARNMVALGQARASTTPSALQPITLSMTENEITALLEKWVGTTLAAVGNHDDAGNFLRPQVVLRNGRFILGARSEKLGTVVSLQLQPKLDAAGQLQMDLVGVYAGRLKVPVKVIENYRSVVALALPRTQMKAKAEKNGISRGAAQAMGWKMVLQSLDHRSSEPILPIPFDGGGNVPMRLSELKIDQGEIKITGTPLNARERDALLERIREPYSDPAK